MNQLSKRKLFHVSYEVKFYQGYFILDNVMETVAFYEANPAADELWE